MTMMVRGAQMYAQMQEAEQKGSTEEPIGPTGSRKLKKD